MMAFLTTTSSSSSSSWLLTASRLSSSVASKNSKRGGVSTSSEQDLVQMVNDEKRGIFRQLDIGLPKNVGFASPGTGRPPPRRIVVKAPPREKLMKPDQDWSTVWPAQRTFHPAVVPLPVRQGFVQLKAQVTPSKYANVELIKIPNFLHLTPPTIRMQCQRLKAFCTPWPKGLETEEDIAKKLPLEEVTSDYLNASSSIRDLRSRVVTLRFRLSSLKQLDLRARDKFIRLVGQERYDEASDTVTITSDRCPYRKQNREYCQYLIRALYSEAQKVEEWEDLRSESDEQECQRLRPDKAVDTDNALAMTHLKNIHELLNKGENSRSLQNYKASALALLGLKDTLAIIPEKISD